MSRSNPDSGAIRLESDRPAGPTDNRVPEAPNAEERLLDAAIEVFARKGRDGARSHEIAAAAGLATPTVNYYFRSKERLYEAAFRRAILRFATGLREELRPGETFATTLRTFIEYYVRFHIDNPSVAQLWIQENLLGGNISSQVIRGDEPNHIFSTFIGNFQKAVAAEEIAPGDPYHTFISVMGACIFYSIAYPTLSKALPPVMADPERFQSERAEHIFNLIYHGLKQRE